MSVLRTQKSMLSVGKKEDRHAWCLFDRISTKRSTRSNNSKVRILSIILQAPPVMALPLADALSYKITVLYMRCSGMWPEETISSRYTMDIIRRYTIGSLVFAFVLTVSDAYNSIGDADARAYSILHAIIVGLAFYKQLVFTCQRRTFQDMINYAKKHFWFRLYDDYGVRVMNQCTTKSGIIIIVIVLLSHGVVICFDLRPLFDNQRQNGSERILPVKLWIDLPTTTSPWYEICYLMQVIAAYHCCICYFCYDSVLCLINLTVIGQFMILQDNLRNLCTYPADPPATSSLREAERENGCPKDAINIMEIDLKANLISLPLDHQHKSMEMYPVVDENWVYSRFRTCTMMHQALISFVVILRDVYKYSLLGVVVSLSLLMSLSLYQMIAGTSHDVFYVAHALINISAFTLILFLSMLTCSNLADASVDVANAAYDAKWFFLGSIDLKKKLVRDLAIVIRRSQKPCYHFHYTLSEKYYFFHQICNTSFSYFTLLRQTA